MEQLKEQKTDRRIVHTRIVLRQSLLTLLRDTPIQKISVKNLCDYAGINRGTFYSHYVDTYDLLHQIELDLFNEMSESLSIFHVENPRQVLLSSCDIFTEVFSCIYKNIDLCQILLGRNGDSTFLRRILYIAFESCSSGWSDSSDEFPDSKMLISYIYSFIANGIAGLIQQWIDDGLKQTSEEMGQIASRITVSGLIGIFGSTE